MEKGELTDPQEKQKKMGMRKYASATFCQLEAQKVY